MPNYANGKIYAAMHRELKYDGLIYVGSTTKAKLSERSSQHKAAYKAYKSDLIRPFTIFTLYDMYGVENVDLFLLEEYPCLDKAQLHAKEEEWRLKLPTVNKCRAIPPTPEELRIERAGWSRKWREKHPEESIEAQRKYREAYPERVVESQRKYDTKRNMEKEACTCGAMVIKRLMKRHEATKKHLDYITK